MKHFTFENNPFMRVMNWAYRVLVVSLLFSLTNILLVLCALFLAVDPRNLGFFGLAMVPFGPSVVALLYVCDRHFEKLAVSPARDYAQGLIRFFGKGLGYWLPVWGLTAVFGADAWFFLTKGVIGRVTLPLFSLLIAAVLGLFVSLAYLQVRNPDQPMKAIWQRGLYFLGRRWFIALANAVLLLVIPVLMVIKPQFGMVITPGLLGLLLYVNCEFLGKRALWQAKAPSKEANK
ncbi:hypothetical protein [Lacticaseibacillus sp. 53-4]|uniref:hypothetical protein n=1 Tax=Lacticaseibacillus sp. 53-4 TaxID=2799575 RepID=UPI00194496D1|nr:hypothetical protein [Lacticaseibacillus sp. 53-4]